MRSSIFFSTLIATLLLAACGCSLTDPVQLPLPAQSLQMIGTAPDSDPAARPAPRTGGVRIDLDRVPSFAQVRDQLPVPRPDGPPRRLHHDQCACLAAEQSELAKLMEQEAAQARREVHRHRRRGPSRLLPGILEDKAADYRNQAAQQALVAYYQLADVHLQTDVLAESYRELDRVSQTVRGLTDAGVPLQMDPGELERRRAELDARRTQLTVNQAQLTAQLRALIGEDPYAPGNLETVFDVEPRAVEYELDEAMRIARQNDFQLKAIGKLLNHGDKDELDIARNLLKVANPLLGEASASLGRFARLKLLCGQCDPRDSELRVRKQQLRELYLSRAKQLDLEVANRVITIQQRLLDVGVAKDVHASWDERVRMLESRREMPSSDYRERVEARFARLQARSELSHQLMLLEIEHARLRGTMGLLAAQCAGRLVPPGPSATLGSVDPTRTETGTSGP